MWVNEDHGQKCKSGSAHGNNGLKIWQQVSVKQKKAVPE
jgi:hypothetical protein